MFVRAFASLAAIDKNDNNNDTNASSSTSVSSLTMAAAVAVVDDKVALGGIVACLQDKTAEVR
jgi:hypothetical protein